ncbi:protein disulfide isomerase pTAC5, chloroplastic isoform X2 [Mangifera indica]|uniref:protein disulfide isomerase pTAC5, chloroplastic isoform X2 n=1 Tax=Mangifera indica TaxID=29780 RepID=UPI001CFBAC64|nr:protein disulfide isomerase pTAC5, chloroplastic isoform X2 [Mangifera indica]
MSSLFPVSLNPPLTFNRHPKTNTPLLLSLSTISKFQIYATSSNSDREEIRWIREEQRWLREEQRWLREEQRWIRERESLLRQISELKLHVKALETRNFSDGVSVSDAISNIAGLLQVLKEKNLIAEKVTVVDEEKNEKEEQKEVIEEEQKEVIGVLKVEGKKWRTLRSGREGDDVKAMQEALLKLGFYSGEEEMEFSSFSTGTERAVKTWQASMGTPEDGIMTAELLEMLFSEQQSKDAGTNKNVEEGGVSLTFPEKGGENGATVSSVTEILELQQAVVDENGVAEVEVSQHRVFLLGENRWEEPSRLTGRNQQASKNKPNDAKTKCLACRGEGRLMCTAAVAWNPNWH